MNFKNKKFWLAVTSFLIVAFTVFGVFAKVGMTPDQFQQLVDSLLNVATEAELIQ